ncbi:MAG: YgjP-like metallopeptidase domain-containing protein [Rhizomicrobium sp.]
MLRIDGQKVAVTMRLNPRARRLIVKVHPSTGEISVIAPSQRALDRALDFAQGEAPWIARQLARVPKKVTLAPGARLPYRGREHLVVKAEAGPVRHDPRGKCPARRRP